MEAIKEIQKEVRSRQILAMIVYALIQMTSLITPYLMGVIIDDYIPNQDIFHIIVGIALFVAIPMMTILLQTIYQYFKFVYLRKKGNEIALRVMKNLVYQKKNFSISKTRWNCCRIAARKPRDICSFMSRR